VLVDVRGRPVTDNRQKVGKKFETTIMARTVRDATLASRSARLRLAVVSKPYWRVLEQGLHLGYRRRATGGSWIARRRGERGIYREAKLGLADDLQDADDKIAFDFSQAQRAARTWWAREQRLESGLDAAAKGPYTVAQAMADYLDDYRRRGGRASDSIESVGGRNILPELGCVAVAKLTTRRLLDWHRSIAERPRIWRSRPGAPPKLASFDRKDAEAVRRRRATANRVLTYLKAALNHAWRNGVTPDDSAWRRVKPFKSVDAPVIRYLSNDEIAHLFKSSHGGFHDLVHAALLTGCRYGELCRLKAGDYNADVGMLAIREAKSGQVRHVTLTDEALELFDRLIAGRSIDDVLFRHDDGRAWKRAEQLRPMREACKRAGIIPAVGFHVLRHTHASMLAMQAVPMAVVARQLGHSDTRMTEKHYAHLAPNYVADMIRGRFPRLTGPASPIVVPFGRSQKSRCKSA
jgi:integrase